jgi:hypothetical protein
MYICEAQIATYSIFVVQVKLALSSIVLLLIGNNLGIKPLINPASLGFGFSMGHTRKDDSSGKGSFIKKI